MSRCISWIYSSYFVPGLCVFSFSSKCQYHSFREKAVSEVPSSEYEGIYEEPRVDVFGCCIWVETPIQVLQVRLINLMPHELTEQVLRFALYSSLALEAV